MFDTDNEKLNAPDKYGKKLNAPNKGLFTLN